MLLSPNDWQNLSGLISSPSLIKYGKKRNANLDEEAHRVAWKYVIQPNSLTSKFINPAKKKFKTWKLNRSTLFLNLKNVFH